MKLFVLEVFFYNVYGLGREFEAFPKRTDFLEEASTGDNYLSMSLRLVSPAQTTCPTDTTASWET